MNEIVSLSKEIDFNTMINKITSISLEHTLMKDEESNIKGDLIVSGTYKQTIASQMDNPFSYKIPVDIVMDEKYDLSDVDVDIDDFTYEIVDDNKLRINVDLLLTNIEKKEVVTTPVLEEKDEIIKVDDLFLDDSKEEKLEIPNEKLETLNFEENSCLDEKKESVSSNENIDNTVIDDDVRDSLFSNLSNNNESYSTYSVYIMRDNDSIENIMERYNVSREQLEQYNDLNNVKVGSKIIISINNE